MSDSKEEIKEDVEEATTGIPETEKAALKLLVKQTSTETVTNSNVTDTNNGSNKNVENKVISPYRVPRLDDICVSFIASNFNSYPILDCLPSQYICNTINSIDLSKLLINRASRHVECSKLWERMAHYRWGNCRVELHGSSWKRLYLEKHMNELLESYYPSISDSNINLNRLLESIKCSSPFIHSIKLNQLPSHLDLSLVLPLFNNLSSLDITYKILKVGINYNQEDFGMNLNDALNISSYLQNTKSLSTLVLSECLIDDETLHVLMGGLTQNITITTLDLSNNKITDVGARRLSTFLSKNDNFLMTLNINNNQINDCGLQYIASTLRNKDTSHLIELDLSLNNISDYGAIHLFESVAISQSLQILNVSCNHITNKSFEALINMLKMNTSMRTLNISGNPFIGSNVSTDPHSTQSTTNYAKELQNCLLTKNGTIANINLLHVGLKKSEIKTINKILSPRKVKTKQYQRKTFLDKSW